LSSSVDAGPVLAGEAYVGEDAVPEGRTGLPEIRMILSDRREVLTVHGAENHAW